MEAGFAALFLAIVFTPALIRSLHRRDYGQRIREEGPPSHVVKAGTPTMGGILIVLAAILGYLVGHLGGYRTFTRSGVLVILLVVAYGAIGLVDDLIGVRSDRNLGLNKRTKFLAQVVMAVGFAVAAWKWAGASTSLSFTRYDLPNWHLSAGVWIVFAALVVVATSNAVNLTDGLDGLAAGSAAIVLLAYIGITFISHGERDLTFLAACLGGACIGFLWFNSFPASIFMGDTGSLGLGGAIAGLAVMTNTEVLLILLGGIFVIEALSVLVQVFSFQMFRKRIFLMAPIHHHFELQAWSETKIILRFWIVAAACGAIGFTVYQLSIRG
jgi:phospho-N-acetylmuramoyl-pentapeptide-transferase